MVYVTHDQIEAMTLATRIAVMRDGRVEQLGTPEEIYNTPATLYVATFVGAPPMNLLKARVAGGKLAFDGAVGEIDLAASLAERLQEGRRLIVGIRPESFGLDPEADHRITAQCEVAELTGPELIVTSNAGGQRLLASLPPNVRFQPGQMLQLSFDARAIHLFDADSGQRLAA